MLCSLAGILSTDIAAIEARHASNREMSLMRARGWLPSLQTLTSKFICRTVRAMKELLLIVRPSPERKADSGSARKGKKRDKRGGGAWHAFMHESFSGGRKIGRRFDKTLMSEMSDAYHALSPAEMARYEEAGIAARRAHLSGYCAFGKKPPAMPSASAPKLYLHAGDVPAPGDETASGAIVAASDAQGLELAFQYQGPDAFLAGWEQARQLSNLWCK